MTNEQHNAVVSQQLTIKDYQELFGFLLQTPESVYDYEDDEAFARLRLQGKTITKNIE